MSRTHSLTPHCGLMAALLVAIMACLACSNAKSTEQGYLMGTRFKQAWADSTAVTETAKAVKAALDSADNRDAFATAFIATIDSTRNPGLTAAAHATVFPAGEAARKVASLIIGSLQSGHDGRATYVQLQATYKGFTIMGRNDLIAATNAALQAEVDGMPVDKQMQVYAAATTPSLLGAVMCREREKSGADTAAISRQAEALRGIYNDAQYRQFKINYDINSHNH